MWTTRSVDALLGQHEPLYGFSVHDVGIDDLFDISNRNASVPHGLGINNNRGAVLALIETSRHIGADTFLESVQRELLLEEKLQLRLSGWVTATAGMSGVALIAANEKMLFELGHLVNLQDFASVILAQMGLARQRRAKHGRIAQRRIGG